MSSVALLIILVSILIHVLRTSRPAGSLPVMSWLRDLQGSNEGGDFVCIAITLKGSDGTSVFAKVAVRRIPVGYPIRPRLDVC